MAEVRGKPKALYRKARRQLHFALNRKDCMALAAVAVEAERKTEAAFEAACQV